MSEQPIIADALTEHTDETIAEQPAASAPSDVAEDQPDLATLEHQRAVADLTEKVTDAKQLLARREQTIAELQLTMARNDLALDLGVDASLIKGGTVEELEAHACQLKDFKDDIERANRPRNRRLQSGMGTPVFIPQNVRQQAAEMLRRGY